MRKEAKEAWLNAEVGPAFDALKADPRRAVTAEQVRTRLADITQVIMKVTTLVLNTNGEPHFQSEDQFDVENLFEISKSREQSARDMGSEWTAGAVSFFGGEVVKAVNTGEHADVSKAIIQMLMATWLFDSLYCGITANTYRESDMKFTITPDGAVSHTRIPTQNKARA
ncbi:hypothetical protein [Acidovorax cattleyae]|uniref:Uncharacterized protein n=1 Tax=Paracidovorax cattleyae TaxID=80868 RepID=A0A1H0WES3_9BURK|nr:hypothetical protein SAMN04489708_13652 [Paracidovorax cattleyae]